MRSGGAAFRRCQMLALTEPITAVRWTIGLMGERLIENISKTVVSGESGVVCRFISASRTPPGVTIFVFRSKFFGLLLLDGQEENIWRLGRLSGGDHFSIREGGAPARLRQGTRPGG
jgi:hypothetical protein